MKAPPQPVSASLRDSGLYLRLLRYVRPYWPYFALGIVALVLLALTEAGIPALLKPVLDGTFVEKDTSYLTWAPLAIVGLFFVRGSAGFLSQIAFAAVATRVVYDLRRHMFDRLLALPTRFYDHNATGTVISKLTYDATQVTTAATDALTVIIKDSVTVLALLVYVFWLDWQLSLFVFVLAPVVAAVAIIVGRRLRRVSRTLQSSFGHLTHVLEETVRGHKEIKIFGAEAYERGRLADAANTVRRFQMKFRIAASSSVPIVELAGAVIMAAVIYIGTARGSGDQLTVGGFVAFFAALGLLFSPIKRLTKVNEPIQRGLAAAESVFGLIDEPAEVDTGRRHLERSVGHLAFEAVRFRYPGSEHEALRGLTFEITPRQTIALVGASGSGKSTLVGLVPRLYEVTEGRILLDGLDIREVGLADLRRQISYVSQDVVLFNDTVAANIAYGPESRADTAAIRAAADAAYATEFIETMAQGFETLVGENGVRLSGGQRQRIAIARALLKNAPILILDEATSALDTESELQVQRALERLRSDRTTLVIAHRLSTVEHADRILVLHQGQIVEDGTHTQLLASNGRYARLYRRQFHD